MRRLFTSAVVLGLLVMIGAVVGCSGISGGHVMQDAPLDTPLAESQTPTQKDTPPENTLRLEADKLMNSQPRDVSRFNLFAVKPLGAASVGDVEADSLEDVLEKGLRLAQASPVHLAVRGTGVNNSVRCAWRGVARTATQREQAVRFWLELATADPLPSAAEVERRFTAELNRIRVLLPETAKANFRSLAQGGLSIEYLFLTCYVDYTASEYILGAGPTTLTLAYDHMAETRSYDLYSRAHTAGEFGGDALLSATEYQAGLDQMVADAEDALSGIVEGRESVVFLAPMGAHHAIAIEAWQVVDQWDVQTVDGVVNAVR